MTTLDVDLLNIARTLMGEGSLTPEQQKAIEQLFLQYGKGVGSFVLTQVGDPELAEEITARVFLTVVSRFCQLRESVLGWLWAIVRTELARHFRGRRHHVSAHGDLLAHAGLPADQIARQ